MLEKMSNVETRQNGLCGLTCWHPAWLQRFANTKAFMGVYGLLGTIQAMSYMYFVVTLTTIEKRFKIPSQTTGIILSGNEISQILLSLILSYAGGQRNRPRWIAWGIVLCALSCYIIALPHFIYGAGEDSLKLTKEYFDEVGLGGNNNTTITLFNGTMRDAQSLCGGHGVEDECNDLITIVPLVLIFLSQFVLGIGNTLYYSLGQTYLDDNTKKTNTPIMLASAMALRMIGPIVGFFLGYASLNMFIDTRKTPLIDRKDQRWLGAWWFGWIILGSFMLLFSGLIGMFPKELPKNIKKRYHSEMPKALRTEELVDESFALSRGFSSNSALDKGVTNTSEFPKLKDFPKALLRLLRNRLLMYNNISAIFYVLGAAGYMTFLTKYMEVQFQKSAQNATIIIGPVTISGMVLGLIASGVIISKKKPSPSKVLSWNVFVGFIYILGQISYMFMYCGDTSSMMTDGKLNLSKDCNTNCSCGGIAYNPVCHSSSDVTYFSPCHAGCRTWDSDRNIYSDCLCLVKDNSNDYTTLIDSSSSTEKYQEATTIEPKKKLLPSIQIRKKTTSTTTETTSTTSTTSTTTTTTSASVESSSEQSMPKEAFVESISPAEPRMSNEFEREDTTFGYETTTDYVFPITKRFRRAIDDGVDDFLKPGACLKGCASFWLFSIVSMIINWFGSSGRIGNILVNYRAVSTQDKSFAQGLTLMMISLFALIPGPIIFGRIIDSTCLVWTEKCGTNGNCQFYDQAAFRFYVNLAALCLTSFGVIFDILVWCNGKNLDLYGEKEAQRMEEIKRKNRTISPLLGKAQS